MSYSRTIMKKLRPFVFCGPSGSGKSTLLKRLMTEYPDSFAFSVSHTTRKPRPGELNGREYHFVEKDEMNKAISNGEFLEHAQFSGNMYGTSRKAVEDVLKSGRICALDVDVQGVINLKKTQLDPIFCFIKPPSLEDLETRLKARGTETDESLRKRLETAERELEYERMSKDAFDHVIVNDDLEKCYETLKQILQEQINLVKDKNNNKTID
jgi:guanylate kinase